MQLRDFVSSRVITGSALVMLAVATLASFFAAQSQHSHSARGMSHIQVLILGGGTSHNFIQNYKQMDAKTLNAAGISTHYTEAFADVPALLPEAGVLIQASNQTPAPDSATRRAIMQFINTGGGLMVVHAATWYNWASWPEYNRVLVGGGSRSHDEPGEFEVTVTMPEHPVMAGVPLHFKIHDELYHQQMDPGGSPVEVLATATSPVTGKTYPSVWVVKHPGGRIVCIALGHDEKAHDTPAYVSILRNAVQWTAKKQGR